MRPIIKFLPWSAFFLLCSCILTLCTDSVAEDSSSDSGKVITVYFDNGATGLVLQLNEAVPIGKTVYAGDQSTPVKIESVLSGAGELRYYSASSPGKAEIAVGDRVGINAPKKPAQPVFVDLALKEETPFDKKKEGRVTAVLNGRAMIDRGTLHEVRERDLYKVVGKDGRYKGMLEILGIGDLQSNGILYDAFEDRRRLALGTVIGDKVIYLGQRKQLGLALFGGWSYKRDAFYGESERSIGGGLLWGVTFRDGFAVEALFGGYSRTLSQTHFNVTGSHREDLKRHSYYLVPIWFKKSFFYPAVVSPFFAAGFYLLDAEIHYSRTVDIGAVSQRRFSGTHSRRMVEPMFGGGVELFPGRFIRPRFDVRFFPGPKLTAAGNTFYTESLFYSLGLFTAW